MYSKETYYNLDVAFQACDAAISNYYLDSDSELDKEFIEECEYFSEFYNFRMDFGDKEITKTAGTEILTGIKNYLLNKS